MGAWLLSGGLLTGALLTGGAEEAGGLLLVVFALEVAEEALFEEVLPPLFPVGGEVSPPEP